MNINMNRQEFIDYVNNCENGTLSITDIDVTRKFKIISKDRVFYKKIWSNDYVETIIDIDDALILFNIT